MAFNNTSYDQNIGRPGVVYILTNPGLREGYVKIGCSRYSGKKRAEDLNLKANTGTPGKFKCIYEKKTQDCGKAEQEVFKILAKHRRGKKYQEFFEVSIDLAKETIVEVCNKIDGIVPKSIESEPITDRIKIPDLPLSNLDQKIMIGGFIILALIFLGALTEKNSLDKNSALLNEVKVSDKYIQGLDAFSASLIDENVRDEVLVKFDKYFNLGGMIAVSDDILQCYKDSSALNLRSIQICMLYDSYAYLIDVNQRQTNQKPPVTKILSDELYLDRLKIYSPIAFKTRKIEDVKTYLTHEVHYVYRKLEGEMMVKKITEMTEEEFQDYYTCPEKNVSNNNIDTVLKAAVKRTFEEMMWLRSHGKSIDESDVINFDKKLFELHQCPGIFSGN